MRYQLAKRRDGTWQAALLLPEGDGSLAAVATGLSKSEATLKAARVATATGKAPVNKTKAVALLATAAGNPIVREALKAGGLKAAEAAASLIPGGGAIVAALKLAAKYGPAKKFLSRLVS